MSTKRLYIIIVATFIGSSLYRVTAQDFGELYRRANNGEVWAMNNLAICYANGEEVEKDLNKAIFWYQKGVENGCETAMYNLSFYYKRGDVVEKSYEKALELLKRSARLKYSNASRELGVAYFNGDLGLNVNYNIAKSYLKDACFTGNAKAMCYYGWLHAKGLGTKKDEYKADYWLNKAIENGYAYANIPLYILSYEKDNKSNDVHFYQQEALKVMDCSVFYNTIGSYFESEHVRCLRESDNNKDFYGMAAFESFYSSYSLSKDAYACAALGVFYEDGIGVEQDLSESLRYYIESYKLGMSNMTIHIKRICRKLDKLSVYFNLLSDHVNSENTDVLNELAYCYAEGLGTSVNITMAHTIIDRAIQIQPSDENLYDSKGEFYMFAGDRKNAQKMYKKVIKMNPAFYVDYPDSKLYNYINTK